MSEQEFINNNPNLDRMEIKTDNTKNFRDVTNITKVPVQAQMQKRSEMNPPSNKEIDDILLQLKQNENTKRI